jgi:hypothetical protein
MRNLFTIIRSILNSPGPSTPGRVREELPYVNGTGEPNAAAGGATVAKELQGKFDVTVLEAGKEFNPFPLELVTIERMKKTGLLLDERVMSLSFPMPLKLFQAA